MSDLDRYDIITAALEWGQRHAKQLAGFRLSWVGGKVLRVLVRTRENVFTAGLGFEFMLAEEDPIGWLHRRLEEGLPDVEPVRTGATP